MDYSEKIKELRKEYKLSQSELAKKLFVSRQAVSLWEQGKTTPSHETLILLKKQFDISIDDWIDNNDKNFVSENSNNKKSHSYKKYIIVTSIILSVIIIFVGIIDIVIRSKILYPNNCKNFNITQNNSIELYKNYSETILFNQSGKPQIKCYLPEEFIENKDSIGLFQSNNGSFIRFNSEYEENVFSPLYGTKYYSYFYDKGFESYIEMLRLALSDNVITTNIFSSKNNLYITGGSRILRNYVCAGQNADYYAIDGGLTENGKETRIYGVALLFDEILWSIILKDCNNNYYFISIKDPNGIGKTPQTITDFLSSINVNE